MAIMQLKMKLKLDGDWEAMKWSIDSFAESVCAFDDAEKKIKNFLLIISVEMSNN